MIVSTNTEFATRTNQITSVVHIISFRKPQITHAVIVKVHIKVYFIVFKIYLLLEILNIKACILTNIALCLFLWVSFF